MSRYIKVIGKAIFAFICGCLVAIAPYLLGRLHGIIETQSDQNREDSLALVAKLDSIDKCKRDSVAELEKLRQDSIAEAQSYVNNISINSFQNLNFGQSKQTVYDSFINNNYATDVDGEYLDIYQRITFRKNTAIYFGGIQWETVIVYFYKDKLNKIEFQGNESYDVIKKQLKNKYRNVYDDTNNKFIIRTRKGISITLNKSSKVSLIYYNPNFENRDAQEM